MIRLGIIGSRRYKDATEFHALVRDCMRELGIPFDPATCHERIVVVTGDAKGVDALAVEWARIHDMIYAVFHAEAAWRTMGKSAGPIRTRMVVDSCDALIALPDAQSVGTMIGIEWAKARMIRVAERMVEIA